MSDLIDRQAAIDAIRASTSKYTGFMEMEMYTDDDAVEAIEALPSAERHGNWVGIDDEPCETFECDRCGFVLEDWIQGAFYNFCPNCGADMRVAVVMDDFVKDIDVLISRQAAIEAVKQYVAQFDAIDANFLDGMKTAINIVKELPSAQPEPLTDKEQRIFLAAMGREEVVCKQVDADCRDCREPYEDSLVRTCHEITRKVKGALWT